MYAIYVVLTCVFYYVGLAYDNVPEVTLFVLFMGGIEAACSDATVSDRLRLSIDSPWRSWMECLTCMTHSAAPADPDRRVQRREEHRRGARARAAPPGGGVRRRGAGARRLVAGPDVRAEPGRAAGRRDCRFRCTCCSTRSTRATAAIRRSAITSRSSTASISSRWCTATASTRRNVCPTWCGRCATARPMRSSARACSRRRRRCAAACRSTSSSATKS